MPKLFLITKMFANIKYLPIPPFYYLPSGSQLSGESQESPLPALSRQRGLNIIFDIRETFYSAVLFVIETHTSYYIAD